MKNWTARLVILLAATVAVLPLLIHGYSCGHDFIFHLPNWMEVHNQWSSGVLLPRWSFRAAWNAGEPRYLFYPPLSWILGALLGTVLPWTAVPIAFIWTALALNGLCFFAFARRCVTPFIATAAACVYLANPYMLFTAYERAAYAELLAAAWMPLLLHEAFRDRIVAWRLAIPIALLWITNAPAAVIGCYSLAVIGIVRLARLIHKRDKQHAISVALHGVGGTVLGLALASFYLLPAIIERKLIETNMAIIVNMRPWDNFLFTPSANPARHAVVHAVSLASTFVLGAAIAFGAVAVYKSRRVLSIVLAAFTLLIAFLVTPASALIWKHTPQLAYLQFPWRVISIEGAVAAMLFALAFGSWRDSKTSHIATAITALALLLFCIPYASTHYRQFCGTREHIATFINNIATQQGDWPADEYTPEPADNDALAVDNPPFWLADTPGATAVHDANTGIITVATQNPYLTLYMVPPTPKPFLILRHRWFRGWHLSVNGTEVAPVDTRDDGLTAIALPHSAAAEVDLYYRWTADQWDGLAVSLFALLVLLYLQSVSRKKHKTNP